MIRRTIYPFMIVLLSICLIEIILTILYTRINALWERIPVLVVILLLPLSVTGAFFYLCIKKPGYLYSPSESNTNVKERERFKADNCVFRSTENKCILNELVCDPKESPQCISSDSSQKG